MNVNKKNFLAVCIFAISSLGVTSPALSQQLPNSAVVPGTPTPPKPGSTGIPATIPPGFVQIPKAQLDILFRLQNQIRSYDALDFRIDQRSRVVRSQLLSIDNQISRIVSDIERLNKDIITIPSNPATGRNPAFDVCVARLPLLQMQIQKLITEKMKVASVYRMEVSNLIAEFRKSPANNPLDPVINHLLMGLQMRSVLDQSLLLNKQYAPLQCAKPIR